MRFITTAGGAGRPAVSFREAVFSCLPETGGLYAPASVPDIRDIIAAMDGAADYGALLEKLIACLFSGDLPPDAAARVAAAARIEPELLILDERFSILRLHTGPTGSFKDYGIAFLSAVFREFLAGDAPGTNGAWRDPHVMVVSSVLGSLGTSMACAFAGQKNITCALLYPAGDIYGLDTDAYMRSGGGNIIPVQLDGSLDDCNRLITELLSDAQWKKRYRTTSANAINPGRLIPQAFYYVYAFIKLKKTLASELFFSVPSGNFGNLIAGLYAWKFGLPVNGFIAAMNVNNALGDLWKSPETRKRTPVKTLSPALDVSYPANHERLIALYGEVPSVMRNMVYPRVITDAETEAAMEQCWKTYGVLLDPHGAVAFMAARRFASRRGFDGHIVTLATGDCAKEAALARRVTGRDVAVPPRLAALAEKSEPLARIPCELDMLESVIASCF